MMKTVGERGVLWPLAVCLLQFPVLIGYVSGTLPVHPMAIVLPLVVFLNARVDGRGPRGLGLTRVGRPGRAILLVSILALTDFGGRLIALRLEGVRLQSPPLTVGTLTSLAGALFVGFFIIALWEEIVNRGYVQTRLQEAWGFTGVLVTAFFFASFHLPSALEAYGWTWPLLLRFVQTGLAGLLLGLAYWWTGSVLITIALHGLRNFLSLSLILQLSGLTALELRTSQIPFQLLWLVGELGLLVFVCSVLFGTRDQPRVDV